MKLITILLLIISLFSCNKENPKSFCKDSLSKDGKVFQCHDKRVKDFSFLSKDKYKNLEALDLTSTSVKNLSFLKSLPNLKALLLIDTKIKDITNIKYLLNLEELYLSRTEVKEISSLRELNKLNMLHIDNTKVKTIENLSLKQLDIRNTAIKIEKKEEKKEEKKYIINLKNKNGIIGEYHLDNYSYPNKEKILSGKVNERNSEIIENDNLLFEPLNYDYLIKYRGVTSINLEKYPDLLISLYHKFKVVEYLNLFGTAHSYYRTLSLNNISGITQLKDLQILKLHLKSDKYIKSVTKLINLKELYLSGNIEKLPNFQYRLEKLYLYNTKVKDFSFLNKSNIKYLYIVTKNFRDDSWSRLKKEYPKIKIEVKNILFTPIKYLNLLSREKISNITRNREIYDGECDDCEAHCYENFTKDLQFKIYLNTNCYYIIRELRKNSLNIRHISLIDIKSLLEKINIDVNHIWNDNITFMDYYYINKQYEKEKFNDKIFNYLKSKGAKRACEILKTKCKPIK